MCATCVCVCVWSMRAAILIGTCVTTPGWHPWQRTATVKLWIAADPMQRDKFLLKRCRGISTETLPWRTASPPCFAAI